MHRTTIMIYSFAHFSQEVLETISEAVRNEFRYRVVVREAYLDLTGYYDPNRRQYNGDALLKVLDAMHPGGPHKLIGLFNVDLFIPILTYIFGQAQFGGRAAIASVYRLKNERYGMMNGEKYLLERFTKEVVHELGHVFGLPHCINPLCVMRSSTYVEDIDQKEVRFCHSCQEALPSGSAGPVKPLSKE